MEVFIPHVFTEMNEQSAQVDLLSWQLSRREVFLNDEINPMSARLVCTQLEFLTFQDPEEPIKLFINSPGGAVSDGLAILDAMDKTPCRMITCATGLAVSMAAVLLAAGDERYATPQTMIMIHQPMGGISGQASDISVVAKQITRVKDQLAGILARACKSTIDEILAAMDRDNWFSAEEARSFGIIDKVGFP